MARETGRDGASRGSTEAFAIPVWELAGACVADCVRGAGGAEAAAAATGAVPLGADAGPEQPLSNRRAATAAARKLRWPCVLEITDGACGSKD
jgi:hypothetical protein